MKKQKPDELVLHGDKGTKKYPGLEGERITLAVADIIVVVVSRRGEGILSVRLFALSEVKKMINLLRREEKHIRKTHRRSCQEIGITGEGYLNRSFKLSEISQMLNFFQQAKKYLSQLS